MGLDIQKFPDIAACSTAIICGFDELGLAGLLRNPLDNKVTPFVENLNSTAADGHVKQRAIGKSMGEC